MIFNFNPRSNQRFSNNLEESNELSPEKLANNLFDNNLTARLRLYRPSQRKAVPEPVQFDEIDASRQLKEI